jgi:hypothetical protein
MKIEITSKMMQRVLVMFLLMGGCAYGCMFVSYIVWFMRGMS